MKLIADGTFGTFFNAMYSSGGAKSFYHSWINNSRYVWLPQGEENEKKKKTERKRALLESEAPNKRDVIFLETFQTIKFKQ